MLLADAGSFSYTFHPEVWLLIAFCLWLGYYISRKIEVSQLQRTAYLAAVFCLWLASDWPLHDLSEDFLYSVHMIQHLLITFVVPPLLLLAIPEPLFQAVFGRQNRILRRLTHPVVAGVAFNAFVAITHLVWVVNTAASNGVFHYLVHAVLFGLALLMWMPVCSPQPHYRLGLPGQMVYLFCMSILPTVPAGFLTFAESPIYTAYSGAFGIAATEDQQAAGLIMKLVGGLYLWGIIAVLFFRWSARQQAKDQRIRSAAPVSAPAPQNLTKASR